jgi:UDP-3-O-[3-hydroxymyristoyl] N-acetylglucosamine deacetylase
VGTVEHLLAVLACRGVDNVRVEVDGPEIPVMDGSAEPFDYLIRSTGTIAQPVPRRVIRIRRPVEVVDPGDPRRRLRIEPARRFSVSYSVDFDHPVIGRQCLEVADVTPTFFQAELARARTFGFLAQVDALRRVGLARGASLANTVVLDDEGVMNEGGLRWADEFVRHKLLDLLGDLALLGHPVRGHVHVERGGHGLHLALLRELCARTDAWKLVGEPAPAPPVGVPTDSVAPA